MIEKIAYMKKKIYIFILFIIFIGCGYKPTSYYTKQLIKENIYIDTKINLENPQNSVLLKEQFIHIIKKNLDVNIVKYKKLANTIFIIELVDVKKEVLQKDENGYVDLYNIIVTISLKYITPYKNNKIVASASTQLSINEDSTLYDEKKLKSIKIASFKAVDDIMSKLLVQSLINSNEKDIKSK